MHEGDRLEIEIGSGGSRSFLEPMADLEVWSDLPLGFGARETGRISAALPARDPGWTTVYDGPGLLHGRIERIRSWRGDDGSLRCDFDDGESYRVAPGGSSIRRSPAELGSAWRERALGPPVVLALACRGVHLLHASALRDRDGRAIALTAPSGGGKSTLAAWAERHPRYGLTRIADDQLPVRLALRAEALPLFPQLKLSPLEQYDPSEPRSLPLRALVELELGEEGSSPSSTALEGARAVEAIVRATVASRLFDGALLGEQLARAAAAASVVPVRRLRYPRGLDRIDEALELLAGL